MKQSRRTVPTVLTALAVVLTPTAAAFGAVVGSTPVSTILTSSWTPPSPDPSGIAYDTAADQFVISDGEVDEMPLYAGANLFETSRTGGGGASGTTLPWSNEPTGIGYNSSNGDLYISDDDKKSIFIIDGPGSDGKFGTGDDGARTSFKTSTFGNTDPEDVAYDSKHNLMLLIDGVGTKWFTLAPGPNGKFDGVTAPADDIATEYDLLEFGAQDPEGIAYDSIRDTVLVVDGSADKILELDHNGSILNEIDIRGADIVKAAGITVAPATNGPGRNYYIADRGLDNNSHPEENDGVIHEISASLPPITNRPPAANAGVDQMMDRTETANLTGSATDDGVPGGAITFSWSRLSGPGTVSFGAASAANTTATFSASGQYVLRLTASDGQLSDVDDVIVDVYEPGAVRTVTLPIMNGADDAQEGGGSSGTYTDISSADNELGNDGPPTPETMLTGLRFANVPVPAGAQIVSARIQFRVDEMGTDAASFTVKGEAADNAARYVSTARSISSRPSTTAAVPWSPPAWDLIGDQGPAQLTPELSGILQEIVNRPGWAKGNAAAFMVSGTGRRTAEAKDGLAPPVLVLQFRTSTQATAPVVSAGSDATVTLPSTAALDGTVTDDGQPGPLTTTWTKVSGPGTVTFGDAAAQDTTASFSAPGSYTLRLSASDTAQTGQDDVVITVQSAANTAPVVNAGPDATVTLPGTASLDGTVTDDGAPGPLTTTWTRVSGPGTVTFGNAAAQDTTASFSAAGTYTLRLSATDTALTGQDDVVITVQAATSGPRIVTRSPASGATGVSPNANVVVTFDRAVTGVSGSTLRLRRVSTGAFITAAVSYAATTRTATLNPSASLASGAVFEVVVSTGIRDSAGASVPAETWRFTTGTTADTTAPRISSRSPQAGATGVSRTANVVVTFNEAVTGTTSSSNFLVRRVGGSAFAAAITYNATTRTATLNPSVTLPAGTQIEVVLTTGIRDTAGNRLAATTWRFTTGA
jgi:hypothetical protein